MLNQGHRFHFNIVGDAGNLSIKHFISCIVVIFLFYQVVPFLHQFIVENIHLCKGKHKGAG